MTVYLCDDNIEGLYSAIFRAYADKNTKSRISSLSAMQSGFDTEFIRVESDPARAERVKNAVLSLAGRRAADEIETAMRSAVPEKADICFSYVKRTLREKRYISRDFAYLEVMPFITLVERVRTERHRFTGFLRFSDRGGVLYARFEPDNDIADLLLPHFARRLGGLPFLIHDARRGRFAAWDGKRAAVFTSEKGISEKDCGDGVAALWKSYFAATDVKERPHPRQQDGYLPRRYRKNMCEFSEK